MLDYRIDYRVNVSSCESPIGVNASVRSSLVASRFTYRDLPTLDQVAKMVDVSPTTLKRQLASAGTTYTGLLDRLRFEIACEMLSIPEMSIKEIAHELCYSGTNNFVRSFRRMTGMSPGQYRRQVLARFPGGKVQPIAVEDEEPKVRDKKALTTAR
jgi:AraC-like DNA-binding protein